MAKGNGKPKDDQAEQPPLVPLTAEELAAAPGLLAKAVKELEDLETEHKEARTDQSAERKKVRQRISSLAGQIRSQGR